MSLRSLAAPLAHALRRGQTPVPGAPAAMPQPVHPRLSADAPARSCPTAEGNEAGVLEFSRGAVVEGFDPETDILELEYTAALGSPEVTLEPVAGGMAVALNGVIVAELAGVEWLDPARIVLCPT